MKTGLRCFVVLLTSLVSALAEVRPVVAIQPLGPVKAGDVARVKAGILALYAVDVEVLAEKPLPQAAWYAPRQRYKADKLLETLAQQTPARFAKVIGLTTRDISTTKGDVADWGILGMGEQGGRPCVVSTFRLRAGKAKEPVFQSRLAKVVNHELGHTFGLDHCPAVGCLMQDARGTIATVDGENGQPCKDCAARLPLPR